MTPVFDARETVSIRVKLGLAERLRKIHPAGPFFNSTSSVLSLSLNSSGTSPVTSDDLVGLLRPGSLIRRPDIFSLRFQISYWFRY